MSQAALALWWALIAPAVAQGADDVALLAERAKAAFRDDREIHAQALAVQALRTDPRNDAAWRVYLRAMRAVGLGEIAAAEVSALADDDPWMQVFQAWWRFVEGEGSVEELEALAAQVPDPGALALAWVRWTYQGDPLAVDALPVGMVDPLAVRLRLRVAVDLEQDRLAADLARKWLVDQPDHPDVLAELWAGRRSRVLRRVQRRVHRAVSREHDRNDQSALWNYRAVRLFAAARDRERADQSAGRIRAEGLEAPLPRVHWSTAMRDGMGQVLSMRDETAQLPDATRGELMDITRARVDRLLRDQDFEGAAGAWSALRAQVDDVDAALEHAALLLLLERWTEAIEVGWQARALAARPSESDRGMLDTPATAMRLADAHGVIAEAAAALGDQRLTEEALAVCQALEPHVRWMALAARAALSTDGGVADRESGLPDDPVVLSVVDTLVQPDNGPAWQRRARALDAEGHAFAAFAAAEVARSLGQRVDQPWPGAGDPSVVRDAMMATHAAAEQRRAEGLEALRATQQGPVDPPTGPGLLLPEWKAAGAAGAEMDSTQLQGTPYVLAVWASWCGPCMIELPELDSRAGAVGIRVVAISVDERESAYRRVVRRDPWPNIEVGWNPDLNHQLGVDALPTTFAVDGTGRVVKVAQGFSEGGVDDLLDVLGSQTP